MKWDLRGWAGSGRAEGRCGYVPVLWEGVSKEKRQRKLGTYDKVDGLGEASVDGRAKRARLLVRDTLRTHDRDEHKRVLSRRRKGMKYLDEETITRLVVEVFTSPGDFWECKCGASE